MVGVYQVVDGTYVVHTTKNEAGQNVLCVYQVYVLQEYACMLEVSWQLQIMGGLSIVVEVGRMEWNWM